MDQKKDEWVSVVDERMKARMLVAVEACFDNGVRLMTDAIAMNAGHRYPTVVALAVLAEEEFAKALLIGLCAHDGRWDSVVFAAITRHDDKQAVSVGMKHMVDSVLARKNLAYGLIPPPVISPREILRYATEGAELAKKVRSKRTLDKAKQNALYVGIDRYCALTNKPDLVYMDVDANQALEEAEKARIAVCIVRRELGIPTPGD